MISEYPEYFARFYDFIYHHSRDGVDNNFYLDKITATNGKVLEAGVGTGRLFIDAINNGADIYGIDISPSMLEVLKNKLNAEQQKRISLQNIIDFKSETRFDLIIAPFRVFMHLIEKHDQLKALNNVFRNLKSGGKFIFDVFIPDLNQLINGIDNLTDFEGEYEPGNKLKRIITTKPDLINQIINMTFRFEWNDKDSIYHEEWETSLRYFFRYELEYLVERSDFNKFEILGDFNGNDLNPESREFIVVCKK
jgi:SAM-dependent methyltransferase